MKKYIKIIILLFLFVVLIAFILIFFNYKFKYNKTIKNVYELLNYLDGYNNTSFYYDNGTLYDENNNIIAINLKVEGKGNIEIDKYNNISINININDMYICKTELGEINILEKCNIGTNSFDYNKNNKQISFILNNKVNGYKVSKNDDFNGNWINILNNTLTLDFNEHGRFYIWFKDIYGNVSDPINFTIECIKSTGSNYDKNILYCSGSIIYLDNIKWLVINDEKNVIDLLSIDSLNIKMNHSESNYRWSQSNINKYLNNDYLNKLSIKNNLLDVEICDDSSGTEGCDSNDGCGGYKKKSIAKYKWKCNNYTKSKVRLISYDEYALLYDNLIDKSLINGYFWTINSYKEENQGISILNNHKVYIGENITNKLEIKPVISIKK